MTISSDLLNLLSKVQITTNNDLQREMLDVPGSSEAQNSPNTWRNNLHQKINMCMLRVIKTPMTDGITPLNSWVYTGWSKKTGPLYIFPNI